MELIGKIIRLDNSGLGMVLEEGDEAKVRSFTFDKIYCYRGEYIKELRANSFKVGAVVKFQTGDNDRVLSIRPLIFNELREHIRWRDFVGGWRRFRDSRLR